MARVLAPNYQRQHPLILGLPRGGVEVASEVADVLRTDMDVFVVHKVGAPGNPEYAIGAISEGGGVWLDDEVIRDFGIPRSYVDEELQRQRGEIRRRVNLYRHGRTLPDLRDRLVVLIDDGMATGYTALSAVRGLRAKGVRKVVLAVPVASVQAADLLRPEVDSLVILQTPDPFFAVGMHYRRFGQVGDEEVVNLLRREKKAA